MHPDTREALEGSIEKWRRIEEGTGVDKGVENCPLCRMFFHYPICRGCPVAEHTGAVLCRDTPYMTWLEARERGTRGDQITAARAERKFLESLRP